MWSQIGLGAVVVFALALLAEALLRLRDFRHHPFDFDAAERKDWQKNPILHTRFTYIFDFFDHFEFDEDILWRPRKNHGVFNAVGLRGSEWRGKKPPHVTRILALGDSLTLGWVEPPGDNWPGLLQSHYPSEDVEVANAAVHGHSSHQGVELLRRHLPDQPDLVIICFGANDAHHRGYSDAVMTHFAQRTVRLSRFRLGQLINWVRVKKFVLGRTGTRQGKRYAIHDTQRVSVFDFRRNLETMIGICKKNSIKCALSTRPWHRLDFPQYRHLRPTRHASGPHDWSDFISVYNTATRDLACEHDLPLIDLEAEFEAPEKHFFFTDRAHLGGLGMRLAADLTARAIAPLLPAAQGPVRCLEANVNATHFDGFIIESRLQNWTGPRLTVQPMGFPVDARTDVLVIETRGWRRFEVPSDIGLVVSCAEDELAYVSRDENLLFFALPQDMTQIDALTLRVDTFSPADDTRDLGLDLLRVSLAAREMATAQGRNKALIRSSSSSGVST